MKVSLEEQMDTFHRSDPEWKELEGMTESELDIYLRDAGFDFPKFSARLDKAIKRAKQSLADARKEPTP